MTFFRDVVREPLVQCPELDNGIFQVPSKFYFSSFMKLGGGLEGDPV